MYIDVKWDLTRLRRDPVLLPSGYVLADDGEYYPGEWVYVDANNRIARVTDDPVTHVNVFPLYTGSGRNDVLGSGTLTVLKGIYAAETDNFTGTPAINEPLTVETDGGTPDRGRLRTAVAGEVIIAIVERAAVSGVNGLIFRRLEGFAVVAGG